MKRQMPLKTDNFFASRKTVKLLEELIRGFIMKRCKTKLRLFASGAGISHTRFIMYCRKMLSKNAYKCTRIIGSMMACTTFYLLSPLKQEGFSFPQILHF